MEKERFSIMLTDGDEIFKVKHDVTRDEWLKLNEKVFDSTDGNLFWDELYDDRTLRMSGNEHLSPNYTGA